MMNGTPSKLDLSLEGQDHGAETLAGKPSNKKVLGATISALLLVALVGYGASQNQAAPAATRVNAPHRRLEEVANDDKPKHTLKITPDSGATRRVLREFASQMDRKLLQTILDGEEGEVDYHLDDQGREFLGTTDHNEMEEAFQRFEQQGDIVDVLVEVSGSPHFETLDLQHMESRHDYSDGMVHYKGIYVEEYPEQEFLVECNSVDYSIPCKVYSFGLFVEGRRKLGEEEIESGNKDQCEGKSGWFGTKLSLQPWSTNSYHLL